MIRKALTWSPLIVVVLCLVSTWHTGRALILSTKPTTVSLLLWQGKLQAMVGDTHSPNAVKTVRFVDVHPVIARASLDWSAKHDGTHFVGGGLAFHQAEVVVGKNSRANHYEIVVPAYVLVVVACTPLLLRFGRWWRGLRWASRGRCRGCGYDLRESRDQCPECGLAVLHARPAMTPIEPA